MSESSGYTPHEAFPPYNPESAPPPEQVMDIINADLLNAMVENRGKMMQDPNHPLSTWDKDPTQRQRPMLAINMQPVPPYGKPSYQDFQGYRPQTAIRGTDPKAAATVAENFTQLISGTAESSVDPNFENVTITKISGTWQDKPVTIEVLASNVNGLHQVRAFASADTEPPRGYH